MGEPISTTILIVGIGTLLIERLFSFLMKIRRSRCCGGEVELRQSTSSINEIDKLIT